MFRLFKTTITFVLAIVGICLFQERAVAQNFTIQNFPSDYDHYYPRKLFVDGNEVWFASKDGITRYADSVYTEYDVDYRIDTVSIIKDFDGNLWIHNTNVPNSIVKKGEVWEEVPAPWLSMMDREGEYIWMNNSINGISRISATDTVTFNPAPDFIEIECHTDGTCYALDWANTLHYYDGSSWEMDTSFVWSNVMHMEVDGKLWLTDYAYPKDRLLMYTDRNSPVEVVDIPYDDFMKINDITSDDTGIIYIATDIGGLIIKNGDVWSKVEGGESGLILGEVRQVEVDANRNVWLSIFSYGPVWGGISLLVNKPSNTTNAHGIVFHDINGDGVKGEDEAALRGHFIHLEPAGDFAVSNVEGEFSIQPQPGENIVTWVSKKFWQPTTAGSYTFTYTEGDSLYLPIGLQIEEVHDVAATLTGGTTRPGFNSYVNLACRNTGTVPVNTELSLQYDPILNFVSSSITPATHTGNTITWTIDDLNALSSQQIFLTFNLPATTPLGTELKHSASVTSVPNETDLTNNIDSLEQIVTGSFDPNDKLVKEGVTDKRLVLHGTDLTYTIRFQNTGTDTAFTVRITDEIHPDLKLTSFEVLATSHPMNLSLSGRTLSFVFDDILLPDSTRNEPESHGFVKYRISPTDGLPNDTEVTNTAAIYFDFNSPVITNTVSNIFVDKFPANDPGGKEDEESEQPEEPEGPVTGVSPEQADLVIYPNPLKGSYRLNLQGVHAYNKVRILSVNGMVQAEFDPSGANVISLNNLKPGLYMIQFYRKTSVETRKIVIEP